MIADKITLLNAKVLECLNETDEIKIVKTFTEVALKVLEADFGFVWLNSFASKDLKLVYKSLNLPFMPHPPRPTGRNYRAMEGSKPDFVSDTRISVDAQYVSPFVRSFVIIPLVYKKAVYGSMVICFKEQEIFSKEKRILSSFIGNSVAETILIRRLIRSERQARLFSEAQGYYFRALFENSHEIIVHISKTGKIVYVSQSIKKILGVEVDDVIGKNVRDFGSNQEGDAHFNYLQNLLQKPKANHVVEFRYRNKDGTVLFLESTSAYLPKNVGVGGIVINIRDISERRKLELVKETKRLLKEERLKLESIADAAHEFRTPLAIIKGNVDLALQQEGKNPKPPKAALRAIDYEVKHLSSILSDLTLITSNAFGLKRKMEYERVDLQALITKVIARCKILARKKNISIIAKNIPQVVLMGNQVYLEKMFVNIVKNSIMYGNKNGHTEIRAERTPSRLTVHVRDDGIGISKEDLPRVFDRFYRADKSHNSEGNSTGLGLAIVKSIAEIHGGSVTVTGKKEGGSTFSVTLPLKPVKK